MSLIATELCSLCGKEFKAPPKRGVSERTSSMSGVSEHPGSMEALSSATEFKAPPKEALSSAQARHNPEVLEADGAQHVFCCSGCRNVWQILSESGQLQPGDDPTATSLYQQAQALGLLGGTTDAEEAPLADLSQVQFAREGSAISDVRQCVLRIEGMWCASCAWLIGHTLTKQKGVVGAQVLFTSDSARVTYRPAKIGEDEICRAIAGLGYRASLLGETDATDPKVRARRAETLRMGVGFVFAMNVMMVSFVLYAGYITGISPTIAHAVSWLLFAFSLPVFFCAWPLFDRAIRAALHGAATMETLVCLGATTAFVYSIDRMLAGSYRVYYDTATMLLGLVLVGKYIENGVRAGASDALSLLHNLLPKKANVLTSDGAEKVVPISSLNAGDRALVRVGERIPADGTVESGTGTVDESLMTGEARPVPKAAGDAVTGGTIVVDSPLVVRIGDAPQEGTVSRMIGLVEEAFAHKTPAERWADRISRVFVPAVIAIAAVTCAVLIAVHAPGPVVMSRAVAILVIACPCALGIATPMAMSAGVGAAAAMGILISDGEALSTLIRLRHLVFDKTGTLTEGRFAVRAVYPENADLSRLAILERRSEHPIARAIEANARMDKHEAQIEEFERIDGAGVRGVVDGKPVFAGNLRMVEACGLTVSKALQERAKDHERAGLTTVYWGIPSEEVQGFIALGDTVREGAGEAIRELTRRGIACEMVSGDAEATVRAVAEQLGIERWLAGATPTQKAEWIAARATEVRSKQSLKSRSARALSSADKGTVGMVGDGVNDAPALAQADIGIAMASGADIAARAAQVSLLTSDLTRIPSLLTLAQKTATVMRQNLFWAFLYNIVCIPLAVMGFVNPLWAAAAMILSSITVIANTKRLQFILGRIVP